MKSFLKSAERGKNGSQNEKSDFSFDPFLWVYVLLFFCEYIYYNFNKKFKRHVAMGCKNQWFHRGQLDHSTHSSWHRNVAHHFLWYLTLEICYCLWVAGILTNLLILVPWRKYSDCKFKEKKKNLDYHESMITFYIKSRLLPLPFPLFLSQSRMNLLQWLSVKTTLENWEGSDSWPLYRFWSVSIELNHVPQIFF